VAVGYLASLVFADGHGADGFGKGHHRDHFFDVVVFLLRVDRRGDCFNECHSRRRRAIRDWRGAPIDSRVAVLAAFGSVFVFLLKMLAKDVSPTYSLVLAALVGANLAWAPPQTADNAGKTSMRDIEGFHLFLEKVEQDQMQRLNAKGEPLGAAIEFVPYAIALEVKESLGDHCAECFCGATTR